MDIFLTNRNLDEAISMIPRESEDYTFKYFLQKRFANDIEGGIKTLLSADKDNEAVMFLVVHMNSQNGGLIKMNNEQLIPLMTKLAMNVSELYLENKYLFCNPKRIKTEKSNNIEDILTTVWSRETSVVNRFLEAIYANILKLETVERELKYLAIHGDKRAWGLLGDIYYYGLGRKRDEKKAMEFFLHGKKANDAYSYLGIGKILMRKPYIDLEQALNIFNEGLAIVNDPEIIFYKYLLMKNKKGGPWKIDGLLRIAAFSGYLPAVYEMATDIKYTVPHNIIMSLKSVIIHSPRFMNIYTKAWKAYKEGNYWAATVLYLYLSEFGLDTAIENALYLLEIENVFETGLKSLLYPYLIELSRFDQKHGQIIGRSIGKCYNSGIGTEQSYGKAFGYFLAFHEYCDESLYNVAQMFEIGKGVPQNLSVAYFYIFKPFKKLDSYLVFFYARLRIIYKLVSTLYLNSYVIISIFLITLILLSYLFISKKIKCIQKIKIE